MRELQSVYIIVNGKNYTVNAATTPLDTSLNTFLRTTAQLRGTKFMCLEGGCGACIVVVRGFHPTERRYRSWSVNSCLTPVLACHGLEVTTVEGIGGRHAGYHAVQRRLAAFNGTQCGYCSPGMVMNMVGLLDAHGGRVSMAQVENSFGGNICRCTGYRPILDAFKSLATDASAELLAQAKTQSACAGADAGDIEDLPVTRCPSARNRCDGICRKGADTQVCVRSEADDRTWHKVFYLEQLFDVLDTLPGGDAAKYMLVAGNTAHGVYRRDEDIEHFIHVTDVGELRRKAVTANGVVLGANVSLTEMMEYLTEVSAQPENTNFAYCRELVAHVDLIANVPVRNAGTIAGNLSIKHRRNEFPSDLYLILEACGAHLTIAESLNKSRGVSVLDFLSLDMHRKVILNVILPPLSPTTVLFRTYKIMPRAQNAQAYVNAGFLVELDEQGRVRRARICFGGIQPQFTHAEATEKAMLGRRLHSNDTLQLALRTLQQELDGVVDWVLPDASPAYRTQLAESLFYRFVLGTASSTAAKVAAPLLSGGAGLMRPLSSGLQEFDTVKDNYPLTQPTLKYEGLGQCAGEAEYVNDLPQIPGELWAAFVPATVVNAVVEEVDAKEALSLPGVHSLFTATDIPGTNNFYPGGQDETILLPVGAPVLFHGQPAALIVADTFELANSAARKVHLRYGQPTTAVSVVPSLRTAHQLQATDRYADLPFKLTATKQEPTDANSVHVTGVFDIGGQYHYSMETQTAVCTPADDEDGLNVYSSTQWVDFTQMAIAGALDMSNNAINMHMRRIGGGYGAKITRCAHIACAAALACRLTGRPVRFVMTLESNMSAVGGRYALINEYGAHVDGQIGRIQRLVNRFAQDYGSSPNEPCPYNTIAFHGSCYATESWTSLSRSVRTDAPGNTWCRAPGSTEGIAMTENLMEHIAWATGLDPLAVRVANMPETHRIRALLPEFLVECEFEKRRAAVAAFNAANRWHKRGIAVVPMDYAQEYFGNIPVLVAIYHADGTVAVTHGGIECGQGINTKVAQVAAHVLGVPYAAVRIKRMDNVVGANAGCTGGSMTSEAVCYATKRACEQLLERLAAVRSAEREAKPDAPELEWKGLIAEAHKRNTDLTAQFLYRSVDLKTYHTYGLTCAEVQLDVLTGNVQLCRVDILEDTGESLSPLMDVGQVEGAFVMGLGYWLTEALVHDPHTGELLTNRTWTYKTPGAKDIPVDFRVRFLRNSPNEFGVLRSKATGEPPICMSIVVLFALRRALESSRADAGLANTWFEMGAPCTPDVLFQLAGNAIAQYRLNDRPDEIDAVKESSQAVE